MCISEEHASIGQYSTLSGVSYIRQYHQHISSCLLLLSAKGALGDCETGYCNGVT